MHFRFANISFRVHRRRLIFGGDLRLLWRFLVLPAQSCLRKVLFPTSAATDLSQHLLLLLLGQHIISKTELLSQLFALKLRIPSPFIWHIHKTTVNPYFTISLGKLFTIRLPVLKFYAVELVFQNLFKL